MIKTFCFETLRFLTNLMLIRIVQNVFRVLGGTPLA